MSAEQISRAADMTKARELREMSDEQIRLVWKDSAETLFKLRLQAQTEKLASPCDVRKQRSIAHGCAGDARAARWRLQSRGQVARASGCAQQYAAR